MSSYLIVTIGQRDLQFVIDNKENYKTAKKVVTQNDLELNESYKSYKWRKLSSLLGKEIDNKGGSKEMDSELREAILSKKEIVFPIFERLILFVQKTINKNSDSDLKKIYLFYTDRQEFKNSGKLEKDFTKDEPYFTAKVIEYFYPEIRDSYGIDADLEIIKIPYREKIEPSVSFEFFDSFLQKNIDIDKNSHVFVGCAGGIPQIREVIQDLVLYYYPDNALITDQREDSEPEISSHHIYKKLYSTKKDLIKMVEQWDFSGFYEKIERLRFPEHLKGLSKYIYSWLYTDVKNLQLIKENIPKDISEILEKMVSKKDENITKNNHLLLKMFVALSKKEYSFASTLWISIVENFLADFLKYNYSNSISEDGDYLNVFLEKIFTNKKKLTNIQNQINKKKGVIIHTDIRLDWRVFDIIYGNLNTKNAMAIYEEFITEFKSFKDLRNSFIHRGVIVSKSEIMKELKIKEINRDDQFIGSERVKRFVSFSTGVTFENYLIPLSKYLLEELRKLEIKYFEEKSGKIELEDKKKLKIER
ncbi:hypothetical protein JXR93_08420 [bacterium]|nr:hypothetical protein [bacterium]